MTLTSRMSAALLLVCFCAVAFLVFGPASSGPFVFDDTYQFFAAPNLPPGSPAGYLLGARPVLQVSYFLNHQVSQDSTGSYHAVNILLHAANAALVSILIYLLFQFAYPDARYRNELAAAGGAFFLVHPLQSEAVAYISARSDLLSSLFFLAALVLFLLCRPKGITWLAAIGITVLFLLALGSKESAVAFPAVLIAFEWIFRDRVPSLRTSGAWKLYGLLVAGAVAGLAVVVSYIVGASGVELRPDPSYFFTQWRVIATYLRLLLLPFGLTIDYDIPLSAGPLDHGAVWYLLLLLGVGALVIWKRDSRGMILFGLLFVLLTLAPTSSVIPIRDPIAERRMYLPMAGIALMASVALSRAGTSRRTIIATASTVLAVYGVLSYQRALAWSSPVALWQSAVDSAPEKSRPRFWLGQAYLAAGQCVKAVDELAAARKLASKDDPEMHTFRAYALACSGREREAAEEMTAAISMKGEDAQMLAFRATYLARVGSLDDAHRDLARALQLNPNSIPALSTRGRIYLAERRYAESVADLERAVRLLPTDASLVLALDEARRSLGAATAPRAR